MFYLSEQPLLCENNFMKTSDAQLSFDHTTNHYQCVGSWTTLHMCDLLAKIKTQPTPTQQPVTLNANQIQGLDSAGALCLLNFIKQLEDKHNTVELTGLSTTQETLLKYIAKKQPIIQKQPDTINAQNTEQASKNKKTFLYLLGKETIRKWYQVDGLIILIGDLTEKIFAACAQWRRFRWASVISNIYSTGIQALPILALLSFLIGIVLAYQMGLQLENYGANVFIAYISGMAIFREFGPLITAIIVAGRTSSAFTAQIGSMKINEEIDALHTMGLSPTELLVLPKTLGLLFIFPILIFWSDFWGSIGAMLMSKYMLNIGYYDFLHRLQESVGLKQMMLGLYKAPTFAILIALVGCFQGFQVGSSADSVGSQTTKSVVQALFLIIIADAIYSIIYSWLNL